LAAVNKGSTSIAGVVLEGRVVSAEPVEQPEITSTPPKAATAADCRFRRRIIAMMELFVIVFWVGDVNYRLFWSSPNLTSELVPAGV
jgi:hypothetical protein